jgi:sugar/nucleoside kinase (ribokinase family)
LLKGKGLRECGCLGDTTARYSISRVGAREGLPTTKELRQHYNRLCS